MSRLVHWILRRRGWRFEGSVPDDPKWIAIGAPHTTNWDFFVFVAALHHFDVEVRFLGKHTLFRWPLGTMFRALGGIPVDRSRPGGVVGQVSEAFRTAGEMVLVLAPEGTRGSARWWKSGFLKIAQAADVPIVFAGIDYPTKSLTLSAPIRFDNAVGVFMDEARSFFSDKRGLHPEQESPVALRDEPDLS